MNVCTPQDSYVETITTAVILEDKTIRMCLDDLELERKPFMKENLESFFTALMWAPTQASALKEKGHSQQIAFLGTVPWYLIPMLQSSEQ